MKRWLALAGFVLGLSLVGYAVFARETDEEQITALLGRIEKAVRVDGDTATNPLFRAAQLRRDFSDVFDKNVRYRIPDLSTPSESAESLVALAARSSVSLTTLDVAFSHVEIRLVPPGSNATADTVAKIRAFRGSEPFEEGERRVRFTLRKMNADWRITSFSVDEKEQ